MKNNEPVCAFDIHGILIRTAETGKGVTSLKTNAYIHTYVKEIIHTYVLFIRVCRDESIDI